MSWAEFVIAVKYFINFDEGFIKKIERDRRIDQVVLIDLEQKK